MCRCCLTYKHRGAQHASWELQRSTCSAIATSVRLCRAATTLADSCAKQLMTCEIACRRAKERLDDYNRRNFTVGRVAKCLQLCTTACTVVGQLQLRQQQGALSVVTLCQS